MQTGKIFFSYSRVDAKFALKLAEDLRKAGTSIWIDQIDIPPSEPWDEEIEKALEASGCLLVILSDTSVESDNVLNEINYALETKKQVLPILLENNIKKPFNIRRLQHIDFTGSYDKGLDQLLKSLRLGKPVVQANRPQGGKKILWISVIAGVAVVALVLVASGLFRPDTGNASGKETGVNKSLPVIDRAAIINGKWSTGELTNPFDRNDKYRVHFDFQLVGETLVGTINMVSATETHPYNIRKGISEGKVTDSTISFSTQERSIAGAEEVAFRNFYIGAIGNDEIRFVLQSDRPWGFPGQKFVARRERDKKAEH